MNIDIFEFYINFESVLIPMFIMIGMLSLRKRKIKAAFYFFYFTYIASFILLLAMIYILVEFGTIDLELMSEEYIFSYNEQDILFFYIFYRICCKNAFISFSSMVT